MTFSAAAAQADAVATLLGCLTASPGHASIVTKTLHVLQCLLAVDGSKAAFMRDDGASQLANLLSKRSGEQAVSKHGNTQDQTAQGHVSWMAPACMHLGLYMSGKVIQATLMQE